MNGSYNGTSVWRSVGGTVNLTLGANPWSSSHVCGTSTAINRLVIGGEANGRTALLTCP